MPRPIRIRINYDKCQSCPAYEAVKSCKTRAIVQPDPDESPYLDIERCRDCSLCVDFCSFAAIELINIVASDMGENYSPNPAGGIPSA
ncbi:conserved hypothetical protein [Candidatus Denitrolinea symbiosum]|jgi:Fe-S-cluster-containing hydrogenase component 2|nr:conserved hypothetical protein [Candidatus Denitrolinea symbiosum]